CSAWDSSLNIHVF
nr:immunoglobulin light chain junction region [Macaca mulatta]MPO05523.1 immunoglobulin light chain junction region [Macaca mulatta]MPO06494.1 immunoglobulin light chain junction region [Macaca mulatta]MPO06529.1 immunoglobulin light chain junction region [Macaca mulatta]MPO06633.1 immunoglobulin light chain junction region [Macaca mulatta]